MTPIIWSDPIPHDGSPECPADARDVPCAVAFYQDSWLGLDGKRLGKDSANWKYVIAYRIPITQPAPDEDDRDALSAERDTLREKLETAEALINGGRDDAAMAIIAAERAEVLALRKERDAAYARGVHDAAAWMDGQSLTEEELQQGYGFTVDYPRVAAAAIRALADAPPVPVVRVTEAAVLKAAAEEYTLDHPREKSEQRMGRRSAVRGMMIRLGLYPELEDAIDATLLPQAEGGDA